MKFSDYYGITYDDDLEWFDPILNTDTRLFVDPFLIFKEEDGPWADAHSELIGYFNRAFEMLAPVYNRPGSLKYNKVLSLMRFPEPQEFCLGYVGTGTSGAGSGKGLAQSIVAAMIQAINRGLTDIAHFEELGFLVTNIDRDRISDITCNVLKPRFIAYTQEICEEWDVPLVDVVLNAAAFDGNRKAWVTEVVKLPLNPFTKKAVLLTPKRFLAELPALNKMDWWDAMESTLRADLNLYIMENVDSEGIVDLARKRPDLVRGWIEETARTAVGPYDVDRDPAGLYKWDEQAREFVSNNPLALVTPTTVAEVDAQVKKMIDRFKHFVEHQGGWKLLYNDDTGNPKHELAIQLLFKGVLGYYCEAAGIQLDREVDLGRGPVDFVISSSATARVLLEIKKMDNGKFWHGLEQQLTSYMVSDNCSHGWYLAVRYKDTKTEKDRTKQLPLRTANASATTGFNLSSDWIDARRKASASKI